MLLDILKFMGVFLGNLLAGAGCLGVLFLLAFGFITFAEWILPTLFFIWLVIMVSYLGSLVLDFFRDV